MTWGETFYNHVPVFTIHDLAQISDWLDEAGELYVDFYPLHGGGGTLQAFIRSLRDLKLFVQEQHLWDSVVFSIFREQQFPLRGVADAALLEQALQQFPPGREFCVMEFGYYPETCRWIAEDNTQEALIRAFASHWGQTITIGVLPAEGKDCLVVGSYHDRNNQRQRRHFPTSYQADPARYQWIVDMWRE